MSTGSPIKESQSRNLPEAPRLLEELLSHRGWGVREGQMTMVETVEDSLSGTSLLNGYSVNAPVGTGKTLGYLIGALPSDGRVLVCTSTKALQDQIVSEELPRLKKDLDELYGFDLQFAVLKGRSNYVCLEKARGLLEGKFADEEEAQLFGELSATLDSDDHQLLTRIIERTENAMAELDIATLDCGDLLAELPHSIRSAISSAKRCSKCRLKWWEATESEGTEEYAYHDGESPDRRALSVQEVLETSECAYRTAYALALAADVLVVNTSLLAAELLKGRMSWEFTPQIVRGTRTIVVDEAHHLARILTDALSAELDFDDLNDKVSTLFRRLGKRFPEQEDRILEAIRISENAHAEVVEIVDTARPSKLRKDLAERLEKFSSELGQITRITQLAVDGDDHDEKFAKAVNKIISRINEEVMEPIGVAASLILQQVENEDSEQMENAYDVSFAGGEDLDDPLAIHMVPIDLSFFRREVGLLAIQPNRHVEESGLDRLSGDGPVIMGENTRQNTLVLCSGTITSETGYIVGMNPRDYVSVPSPFDPIRHRLCVPEGLPNPNWENWFEEVWPIAKQAILKTGGRTLILCTSHRNKELFADKCLEEFPEYTVMYQGNGMQRTELRDTMKEDETSILVATTSFFEGFDIPGPALSLTIMDKIMFPTRDDPVFSARRKYVEKHDGNAFIKVDVDHAAIMFAQGDGRQQRAEMDIGGTLVLDSRAEHHRMYGSLVTSILPAATPFTSDVEQFYDWMEWAVANTDTVEVPDPDPEYWRPLRVPRRRRRRA